MDVFRVHILTKILVEGFEIAATRVEPPPSKLSFSLPKTKTIFLKITLTSIMTSWNWLTCISHQVSSITKIGRNGKRKTLNHDVGATFTKLKRGRTPKTPTRMRNGKRGRGKQQKKIKLKDGMASTKKFKITKHVHWSLTLMSNYVKILQDPWLFNIVC